MRLYSLLIFLAVTAGVFAQDDRESTMTLVIAAQTVDGNPLKGVSFTAGATTGTLRSFATSATGMARVPLRRGEDFGNAVIHLSDSRYQMMQAFSRMENSAASATEYWFAHLIPADVGKMNAAERMAYVYMMPDIMRERWERGGAKGAGEQPLALRMAPLLEGFGTEQSLDAKATRDQAIAAAKKSVEEKPVGPQKRETTLEVVLRDPTGLPAGNRMVILYGLGDRPGTRRNVDSRRTDQNGVVRFPELEPQVLYRALAPQDGDESYAPGRLLELGKGEEKRTILVLRERQRSLSGVVANNGIPAPGVSVSTSDPTQPQVETITDEFGYFELGPLRSGETMLTLREPRTQRTAKIGAVVGGSEMLIPLEVVIRE